MIDHCEERIYKVTTTVLSELLTFKWKFHGNIKCNKYHRRKSYRNIENLVGFSKHFTGILFPIRKGIFYRNCIPIGNFPTRN